VAGLRGGRSPPRAESEVEEQVFLAADHRPAAGFDEQIPGDALATGANNEVVLGGTVRSYYVGWVV
jgi:hypothetical protein